jgi:hypothetical protein
MQILAIRAPFAENLQIVRPVARIHDSLPTHDPHMGDILGPVPINDHISNLSFFRTAEATIPILD